MKGTNTVKTQKQKETEAAVELFKKLSPQQQEEIISALKALLKK